MAKSKEFYLHNMGIQVWSERNKLMVNNSSESSEMLEWRELEQQVATCRLCGLCEGRQNTVFGVGNKHADLLIIGEAPGATEDATGEPFVGRAGKVLDNMLTAIHLQRKDIFIANILKCRPPKNRDPLPLEVATCTPYLTRQIALLKPKLIVAVGRIAAHFLLDTKDTLGSMRGKVFTYGEANTPLIVTYHPAYLLRNPHGKAKAYEDWQRVQQLLVAAE